MRQSARLGVALIMLLGGLGCARPPAVFDAQLPYGRVTETLRGLVELEPLEPKEAVRVHEIGRDDHSSHHLVRLRGAESPHRHDRHELLVVILKGHGWMRVGREVREVGEGSILYVPRGTVHAFINEADEPAVAYVAYTPAFDGKDRISVD